MAKFLELEAVAEMLGITRNAVYVLVRTGELAGIKINSGWLVERAEVLRYQSLN